jgi:hypothetical protein
VLLVDPILVSQSAGIHLRGTTLEGSEKSNSVKNGAISRGKA